MKRLTRIVCLLLACSCLLGALQGLSPRVGAYPAAKPLPELTGNKAQDVANIAISQLGYHEDSSGTVYGAWWTGVTNWGYDYTRAGWCSIFAMWCAHQAGAGMDIAFDKRGAVPDNCLSWLQNNASADRSFTVEPAPGDFIFFSTGSSAQHVAIVVAYDSATNQVTFVGGNQSDKVSQFTMKYTSSAKYGSQRIIAIGRPKYGTSTMVPSCSCSEDYAGYYQCITASDYLNIRGGHGTSFSVVGSMPPGATVYVSKAQGLGDDAWAHVEYNGIKGYASMKYLKRLPEYTMEVVYDEATGEVAGANVEIFDYVTSDDLSLTLPEQLRITAGGISPVIQVKAKEGFVLHLEIPLSADSSNVAPVELKTDGQTVPLDSYTATDSGILVSIVGSMDVQLLSTAPAHTHSYTGEVTTAPTCEDAGLRTYTCECGESYTQQIAALGHAYSEKVTAPTCEGQGYTTFTCANCGNSYQDGLTPAKGHSYTGEVTTAPTCEDAGLRTYICGCGESYTQQIAALGHVYSEKVTAPTCEGQGYTTFTCANCGNSYQDGLTPAKGHSYTGEVTTAPTCEDTGLRTYTCECGESYTQQIAALGHAYSEKVTAPTCESQGYTTFTCAHCGNSYEDLYVKATGHSYAAGKCQICGTEDPDYQAPAPGQQNGLLRGEDGNFYYYVNGQIQTEYTGLVGNAAGNWYIQNGVAQMRYDGLVTFEGTRYLIKAGRVSDYTGIAKQEGVYYYFAAGVNDLEFAGLVLCNGMKAYVQNGEVDFNKTAVVDDDGVLCFVKYGIWRSSFKGLARDERGEWLYMENGMYEPSYTGVAKLNSNWVYISEGYVDFKFSGTHRVNGVDYTVKYGIVQF